MSLLSGQDPVTTNISDLWCQDMANDTLQSHRRHENKSFQQKTQNMQGKYKEETSFYTGGLLSVSP